MKNSKKKLEVKDLRKEFVLHNCEGRKIKGYSEVNFSVSGGELLALTGPSGSGKSSILKTIYRTYIPTGGYIHLYRDKEDPVDLAQSTESEMLQLRKREIGFVTQFLKVLPRVSALDVVAAPLLDLDVDPESAREKAGALLKSIGIREELFHISPLTFSGGEQQRVNIARGVIAPKKLLLLDEPTASLDEQSADCVLNLLDGLKKQNIALVGIFHDLERMERVADREYCLQGSS